MILGSYVRQVGRRLRSWLDEADPQAEGRLKGFRLGVVYAIAAFFGRQCDLVAPLSGGVSVAVLAAGFALWASVVEDRTERASGCRDLAALCFAATAGAIVYCYLAKWLRCCTEVGPEAALVTAAFLVAYLRRFGTLGAAIGSLVYIGQLLAFGADARPSDVVPVGIAGALATMAVIVPRCLICHGRSRAGPAVDTDSPAPPSHSRALLQGVETAAAAFVVVLLNNRFALTESAWAVTACVYVITATLAQTVQRARQRICGTFIGVPIGLLCMPIAAHFPVVTWVLAGVAMIVFAIALRDRYDIACGAFAFVLIVTLEISGQHSVALLLARIWETVLGATLGIGVALGANLLLMKLRLLPENSGAYRTAALASLRVQLASPLRVQAEKSSREL
jgi:hypothetical protein